jgi:hypothetical protein
MAKEAGLNLVHAAGMSISPSRPGGFMLTGTLTSPCHSQAPLVGVQLYLVTMCPA